MRNGNGHRVAVITGGAGGLGQPVVRRLIADGFQVHVPWVREKEEQRLQAFLGTPKALTLHHTDLTSEEQVAALFARIREEHGRVDALCNLAGGFSMAPALETECSAWEEMFAMNATSAFLTSSAAASLMKEAGAGRIVNVAAMPALENGAPGMAAYSAAKAAVLNLTQSLAKEFLADRITVNAIAPTIIDTPGNRAAMPDSDRTGWLDPDEIATVISFLVSDAAKIVTGSVLALKTS